MDIIKAESSFAEMCYGSFSIVWWSSLGPNLKFGNAALPHCLLLYKSNKTAQQLPGEFLISKWNKSYPWQYNVQPLWFIQQEVTLYSFPFECKEQTEATFLEFSVQLEHQLFYAQQGRYLSCPEKLLCHHECFPGAKQNNTGLFTLHSEQNKQQHGNNKLHQPETWIKKLFANMCGEKRKKKKSWAELSYGCIGTA